MSDREKQTGRRALLRGIAAAGGASVLGIELTGTAAAGHTEESNSGDLDIQPFTLDDRIGQVESEREAARESLVSGLKRLPQTYNEDYETTVTVETGDRGQETAVTVTPFLYTKGMRLETDEDGNPYPEGLVAYSRKIGTYQKAILEQDNIDSSMQQGGDRLFIGVPAVHTVTHSGMDPWRGKMPPAPSPTGVRNAGEMIDLYAMEQLRDTPFVEYPNEPGASNGNGNSNGRGQRSGGSAQEVIDALSTDIGRIEGTDEVNSWWHDTDRLFVEADTSRDKIDWGPFLSQFLLQDVNMWALPIEQQYLSYEPGADYNGTQSDWLTTLRGGDDNSAELNPNAPESNETSYISTGRDLATIVNAEPPFQEYLIAALYLIESRQGKFAEGVPYNSRDDGSIFDYTGSGPVGILDLLTRGARQALVAAFYQKWYVHFRCRPETYAGRVHHQRNGSPSFGINNLLLDSEVLSVRDNNSDFLTTAYVEGSPLHPAYPSGHSVIAGACGTILKVLFENVHWDRTRGNDYYVPTANGNGRKAVDVPENHQGVYQEIDKLISNVGLARMFAGVHYYSDHYWGVKLGEQVAVGLLYDFFERDYTEGKEINATFTPFLDYDTTHSISIKTLEHIREQSIAR